MCTVIQYALPILIMPMIFESLEGKNVMAQQLVASKQDNTSLHLV